jgi:hypothetical protein
MLPPYITDIEVSKFEAYRLSLLFLKQNLDKYIK